MSHPSKRPKLHGQSPNNSISAFSQVRKQRSNSVQETLRSSTGQGKHTKFQSESPEPTDTPLSKSKPTLNRVPNIPSAQKAEVTTEGLTEIEAIELRRKNEKAKKKHEKKEKKRRRREERNRRKSEGDEDDGEYSSWHGFDDEAEGDLVRPHKKKQKSLVEEAVVVELEEKQRVNGLTSKQPQPVVEDEVSPRINKANSVLSERSPKKKKKRKSDLHQSPADNPVGESFILNHSNGTSNILPESLTAPLNEPNPAKGAKKIQTVWERLSTQMKPQSNEVESVGSSRNSAEVQFETPAQQSETSMVTIHSADAISPEPQPTKPTSKVLKPPGQPRVYKNLPSKYKSPTPQDVGNDSIAGLVDPKTPVLSKPQAKTKSQVSQELQEVRKTLPIWNFQGEIQSTILDSDTMVLVGETGSGKSTQIGQFLLNQPWMSRASDVKGKTYGGCIAITQPRRVAAISLAQRVSNEMGTYLGKEVGYCVRFDDQSQRDTKIRYLTDGMLLNEILRDPELSRYSAVVVDEAHERSVSTDLGLGLLKGIVESRRKKKVPLKLIVMSATLDIEKMTRFVGASPVPDPDADDIPPAPVCKIPGKIYPVDIYYTPNTIDNFQTAAVKTIFQVHYQQPCPGDILVFSTGSEEIEDLASTVEELALQMEADKPKMQVLKLYASLDPSEQQKVFTKGNPNARRVIIATNIAETSVTVPGVRHVIDCGKVKMKRFRHQLGIESLLVTDISQASALQRKGRAGREAPGTCFRLYPEDFFKKFAKATEPEILHCDLAGALLTLKARGVDDIFNFPFLDRPNRQSFEKALLTLHTLDALDNAGKITDIGRKMSRFPLPPVQSRVIVAAGEEEASSKDEDEDVLVDVIDVLSCLSVDGNIILQSTRWNKVFDDGKKSEDPLVPSKKKKRKANKEDSDEDQTIEEKVHSKRMEVVHPSGDHLTYLNILRRYLSKRPAERKQFCQDYQVSYPLMRKVENIRKQLRNYCRIDNVGDLPRDSDMKYESETMVARYPRVSEKQTERILRCFLKGVGVGNVARRVAGGKYRTLTASGNAASGVDVGVHPSSCLMWERNGSESKKAKKEKDAEDMRKREEGFGEAVMYQDVVWTSKAFMKCVSRIKLEWVAEMWAE
ncbi:hypothetical protein ABW19_dt0201581 [Dactylella cylindrospora]|nr:hypothetical protein ABW19_dt0201581 [Dactylella cylindrospora]